jgi:hypothetical protein
VKDPGTTEGRWRLMVPSMQGYLRELADDPSAWNPAKLRTIADALGFVLDAGALVAEWVDQGRDDG